MNSHTYGHLNFDKGAQIIQWKKKESIFHKWCDKLAVNMPFLFPCSKLKSKWIKDLHIKPHTFNLIEDKVGKNLENMGTGEIFLNRKNTKSLCSKMEN